MQMTGKNSCLYLLFMLVIKTGVTLLHFPTLIPSSPPCPCYLHQEGSISGFYVFLISVFSSPPKKLINALPIFMRVGSLPRKKGLILRKCLNHNLDSKKSQIFNSFSFIELEFVVEIIPKIIKNFLCFCGLTQGRTDSILEKTKG